MVNGYGFFGKQKSFFEKLVLLNIRFKCVYVTILSSSSFMSCWIQKGKHPATINLIENNNGLFLVLTKIM